METNILEPLTKIVRRYDANNATGMLKKFKIVLLAYFRNKNVSIQKHNNIKLKPEQDFSIRIFKLS